LRSRRHTISVEADSLHEAACLAVPALRKSGFVDQQPGPASKLQVQVTEVVTHEVTVAQVQRWLALGSSTRTRRQSAKRLREVFSAK
jgi:hypothetical protein